MQFKAGPYGPSFRVKIVAPLLAADD